MPNLATIFVCMLAGYLLRIGGRFPAQSAKALNTFIIYVSFPALILHHIPITLSRSGLSFDLLLPASMPWVMAVVAYAGFSLIGKWLGFSKETVGALALTAGFSNTSLVGFPILEALLGEEALETAVIISQAGSFLALSTLGLVLASTFSRHSTSLSVIFKRLLQFPPFLAMLASLLVYLTNFDIPDSVDAVLLKLAAALVPVALVSVGNQVRFNFADIKSRLVPFSVGLGFKLVFAPVFFGLLYMWLLNEYSLEVEITVLEAAMAPMITGCIVASQFELDEELGYLLVGIGIPISLVTVPGWFYLARHLFL